MGPKSGRDSTAIVFSVKDRPGILFDVLGHFARRGINLSKIESRPLKGRAWEYVFFVEMDGHISDADVREAAPGPGAGLRVRQGAGVVSQDEEGTSESWSLTIGDWELTIEMH